MSMATDLFGLDGRTALVTGGSRGLGLQIAEALGAQGARVLISSRKADSLESAQEHLSGLGVKAEWIAADCSKEDEVVRLAEEAVERLGTVDILVNNAGATWGARTEDHPLAAWDKVMNLNVRSLFLLSQQIGKLSMIPAGSGRILNLASIAGLRGNGPSSTKTIAYNTSKAAVINFTRALAAEWAPHGINVNALAPGFFPSDMTRGTLANRLDQVVARVPQGKIGDGEDLKGAALLFTSDAGKHITGQVLAVDGGATAI
ncbi:3-oxoacyl-(acyl-carrier-protein) reductase (plasmid) [Pseudonocardia dioxanivorans CB1190]|uniref:3-oxoacyl-(Acyl-carrier-protein) reductase n=1 Tax=Pseudonocardia dioxanivorans (strain ATCC 55486 / DSM 44775 / JCM 13855 / CB1190) TaxID=675635 RepID=F2L6X9_PSEUX|nr:SDR family oxidoreductase [Pseudonocardia dioxanivorans]AEA28851.1 3-oxoacyl-(acyl-carrier-protein) reductase [Pseudonocardia dioxanivorans CB1190]